MALKHSLQAAAVRESLRYVGRNPGENIGKLVNLLKPFARVPEHREILCQVEEVWQDPENNWRRMTERAFAQLSPGVMEKFVTSFLLNAAPIGVQRRQEMEEELQCNVPWAILMDPTSDCNLRCKGCWQRSTSEAGTSAWKNLIVSSRKARNWGYTSTCTQVANPSSVPMIF